MEKEKCLDMAIDVDTKDHIDEDDIEYAGIKLKEALVVLELLTKGSLATKKEILENVVKWFTSGTRGRSRFLKKLL